MKQTKVSVHKIMPIIYLELIEKQVLLKSSSRRGGGQKGTEALNLLH
jgi:hypothetical protein